MRPGYLGLITYEAWLPQISHRFFCPSIFRGFVALCFPFFISLWVVLHLFSLNLNLLSLLSRRGGSFFLLLIYERGQISLRSVCMGKESAMRILTHVEDLSNLWANLREQLGRVTKFLFCNWGPTPMVL